VLLSAAVFFVRTAWMMLGPLLVTLASAFDVSLAAVGQLAASIGITWGVTALLVGPVSDIYGRRAVGLTGLALMAAGMVGSALSWNYGGLLAFRLLTGAGAAMIPSNSVAMIADQFPPEKRGTPISILVSASFFALVVSVPLVAFLADVGGWRLPFYVVGALLVLLLALQWFWLPSQPAAKASFGFGRHFREVVGCEGLWYLLAANMFYQIAALGVFTYLVALLIGTYGLSQRETVLPLAIVGLGAMTGSLLGGRVASRARRIKWSVLALVLGGIGVCVAFAVSPSPWITIGLCGASALLLTIFEPVTWALTAELAGESRATANGFLATSNQFGIVGGASVGGLVLAVGGFGFVGIFCLAAAILAAALVTRVQIRRPKSGAEPQ
jgi:predicted MFS family arabinose efflux permease